MSGFDRDQFRVAIMGRSGRQQFNPVVVEMVLSFAKQAYPRLQEDVLLDRGVQALNLLSEIWESNPSNTDDKFQETCITAKQIFEPMDQHDKEQLKMLIIERCIKQHPQPMYFSPVATEIVSGFAAEAYPRLDKETLIDRGVQALKLLSERNIYQDFQGNCDVVKKMFES